MFSTTRALHTHAVVGLLLLGCAPWVAADDGQAIQEWQLRMLLEPTPTQLEMEQRKQTVFIYSRMKDSDISRAMEEQFGRVQHMMFVNTLVTKEPKAAPQKSADGESSEPVVVEDDDGC